MSTYNYFASL